MRAGVRATTAQASVFERHQSYQSVLGQHDRALYLCVGSVYTGNYAAVTAWKRAHYLDDRLTVVDTGLASGRLGIAVRATARVAQAVADAEAVIRFAREAARASEEYIFLDRLQYLAAGGRLSKTRGFIGDLLNVKPIITPTPEGAVKVGRARTRREQAEFALARLEQGMGRAAGGLILARALGQPGVGRRGGPAGDPRPAPGGRGHREPPVPDLGRPHGPRDLGGCVPARSCPCRGT